MTFPIQPPMWAPGINLSDPDAQGLAGYWPLWEGDGDKVMDLSGNGNHGTLTNMDPATDWIGSPYGWALDFDGVNAYVKINHNDAYRTPEITVRAWICAHNWTVNATDNIMCEHDPDRGVNGYWLREEAGNLQFLISDGGVSHKAETIAPSANVRHQVVGTYDGKTVRLFVDGTERDSTAHVGGIDYGDDDWLAIGSDPGFLDRCFDGLIADAEIRSRALTPSEIQQNYADPWGLSRPEPVMYPMGAAGPGVDELFAASQLQPVFHNPAPPVPVPY